MKSAALWFVVLLALPVVAFAEGPTEAHLSYETYAAGLHVAEVDAGVGLGASGYQIELAYHTTGITSVFLHGHQYDSVSGNWSGLAPRPSLFAAQGLWHGEPRVARIEYDEGMPVIRELTPPNNEEREPVPGALQRNTIDTVSALAQLLHTVEQTGRCDATVRTFDGRRLVEVRAMTVGEEMLRPSSRSIFAGKALRCDFSGHLVAGFKLGDDRDRQARPLNGSAWLAPLGLGGAALPVRMTFQTRWVGTATMYLTAAGTGAGIEAAERQQ